jgi:hypothetical protein
MHVRFEEMLRGGRSRRRSIAPALAGVTQCEPRPWKAQPRGAHKPKDRFLARAGTADAGRPRLLSGLRPMAAMRCLPDAASLADRSTLHCCPWSPAPGRRWTTHRSRWRFSQRATGIRWSLTFTNAAEKVRDVESGHSRWQSPTWPRCRLSDYILPCRVALDGRQCESEATPRD